MLQSERNVETSHFSCPVPWRITRGQGPVVATAIHAGHDGRPEVAVCMAITEDERRREEDPLTGYWTSAGDFVYQEDGSVHANASRTGAGKVKSAEKILKNCRSDEASERIIVDELDVLQLRNDPAEDAAKRPWAQTSEIL